MLQYSSFSSVVKRYRLTRQKLHFSGSLQRLQSSHCYIVVSRLDSWANVLSLFSSFMSEFGWLYVFGSSEHTCSKLPHTNSLCRSVHPYFLSLRGFKYTLNCSLSLNANLADTNNMIWTMSCHAGWNYDSVTSVDSSLWALGLCYIIILTAIRGCFCLFSACSPSAHVSHVAFHISSLKKVKIWQATAGKYRRGDKRCLYCRGNLYGFVWSVGMGFPGIYCT